MEMAAYEMLGDDNVASPHGSEVELVDFDPEGELKVVAAMLYPHTDMSESSVLARVHAMSDRRSPFGDEGIRRPPPEPTPPPRTCTGTHRLPLRRTGRLRRLQRPAATPDRHHRVATARPATWLRQALVTERRRSGPDASTTQWGPPQDLWAAARRAIPRQGQLRRIAGPPHPLRDAVQCARGHPPARAAFIGSGPSQLPGGGTADAPADRAKRPGTARSPQ